MSKLTTEDTEDTENTEMEKVMVGIKCPVPLTYFLEILEVLSITAKAEGRTAFTRQAGDWFEIYSIPDAKEETR
jgi:hypothetical protein